jgi:hypothetical protein
VGSTWWEFCAIFTNIVCMSTMKFSGKIPIVNGQVKTNLQLLTFEEDGVLILYAPALDVLGSGYDFTQAKASFYETLSEFFRYTTNKKTLISELKRLGWSMKGKSTHLSIHAPDFNKMYKSNEQLQDIIDNKSYHSFREDVEIPVY